MHSSTLLLRVLQSFLLLLLVNTESIGAPFTFQYYSASLQLSNGRSLLPVAMAVPNDTLYPWQCITTAAFVFWYSWILSYPLLVWLLFTSYFWISLVVFTWMVIDDSQNTGGRSWRPLRDSYFTRFWYRYFPVSLRITAPEEITPENNYVFGCYPHGIMALGVSCAFATEGLEISKRLPGMKCTVLVTRIAFAFPFVREFFLWLGCTNASKRNIKYIAEHGKGNVIALCPGGAAEIFEARPGKNTIVLESRKGFIRIALETGCHLVPVYSFGETDTFDQVFDNPVRSRLRKLQRWFASVTGAPLTAFYGRSKILFWQPRPKPINVVVGRLLTVRKVAQPSEKEINDLHAKYKDAVRNLFEEHKAIYGFGDHQLELT